MLLIGCSHLNSGLYILGKENKLYKVLNTNSFGFDVDINKNIYINTNDYILKYDINFDLINSTKKIYNINCLTIYREKLYVISNNRLLLILDINTFNIIEKIEFKGNYLTNYNFQIKDLLIYNDEIYMSLHNINSKIDGKIINRHLNEHNNEIGKTYISNISDANSLFIYQNELHFCNSHKRLVSSKSRYNILNTIGYTKGLYINDQYIYVGINSFLYETHNDSNIMIYDKFANTNKLIKLPSNQINTIKNIIT